MTDPKLPNGRRGMAFIADRTFQVYTAIVVTVTLAVRLVWG